MNCRLRRLVRDRAAFRQRNARVAYLQLERTPEQLLLLSTQSLEAGVSIPSVISIAFAVADRQPARSALSELALPCRPRAKTP